MSNNEGAFVLVSSPPNSNKPNGKKSTIAILSERL